MTSNIPDKIHSLFCKMMFIAEVPKGSKLNFETQEYSSGGMLEAIRRTLYRESRDHTREEVKRIAEEACQTLQDKRGTLYHSTLLNLSIKMRDGIKTLVETYSDCPKTQNNLNSTIIFLDYNIIEEKKWENFTLLDEGGKGIFSIEKINS